jgi:hypothetical protein
MKMSLILLGISGGITLFLVVRFLPILMLGDRVFEAVRPTSSRKARVKSLSVRGLQVLVVVVNE